jgi:hypothetical protein
LSRSDCNADFKEDDWLIATYKYIHPKKVQEKITPPTLNTYNFQLDKMGRLFFKFKLN